MAQPVADLEHRIRIINRPRLVREVLAASTPIVLIDAPAGMGKSVLLAEIAQDIDASVHRAKGPPKPPAAGEIMLWDIPLSGDPVLLPDPEAIRGLLIIAKRPEHRLQGSERAEIYGRLTRLSADDLRFNSGEIEAVLPAQRAKMVLERTGGWPMLFPLAIGPDYSPDLFAGFLAAEYLPALDEAALAALAVWLDGGTIPSKDLARLSPLIISEQSTTRLCMPDQHDAVAAAVDAELEARLGEPDRAARIADIYVAHGKVTEAICILQSVGYLDWALDVFVSHDGLYYIYRFGQEAYARVLAGFPESFAREHEVLIVSNALRAVKTGDVQHARRLITEHFGATVSNPAIVLSGAGHYSLQLRYFRLMLLMYEDVPFTEELLEQGFRLIADAPVDAHTMRGSGYNSIMEYFMRRRRFAEAEDLAAHAHYHYEQAGLYILQFYISLHRAIMRLTFGDTRKAAAEAERAASELAQAGYDSPGDARLLAVVQACIAFEQGNPEQIIDLLSKQLQSMLHGEMWPSIAELFLQYGSFALAEHLSVPTARDYLDHWRIYQQYNRQFQAMIDIREAAVLQNANRWQEAAERLADIPGTINRAWLLKADDEVLSLHSRDEIFLALFWLRQIVFEKPARPGLDILLQKMGRNLYLTGRQRFAVEIWLAYVYRVQGNQSAARRTLQKTLEEAGRLGALMTLAEERQFLDSVMSNQRIADFVLTSPAIRQTLRKLSEVGATLSAKTEKLGLTRREARVLLFLTEGASNKNIAQALGLSEATVKFHLANLYRKLGCNRRKEAISAARSLGVVD